MRTRRQRPTPSTRGGRVKGTPRVRRRRAITDPKKSADQIIKAFQTKARSNKATKARSTPTPKAPTKPTKQTLQTTMSPRPVRKRPDVRPTRLNPNITGGKKATIAQNQTPMTDAQKKTFRQRLEQFIRGNRQKPGGTKPKPKAVPKGTKTGPAVKGEMTKNPRPKAKPRSRPTPSRPTRGPIKPGIPLPSSGPRPKPKTPRPTRPPTRRPSRKPKGFMEAIRSGRRPPTRRPRLFSASSRPTRPPTRRPSRKPRRGFQR